MNIQLKGTNTIGSSQGIELGYGIQAGGEILLTGETNSKLEIFLQNSQNYTNTGIYNSPVGKAIQIKDVEIKITGSNTNSTIRNNMMGICSSGELKIENSTLNISGTSSGIQSSVNESPSPYGISIMGSNIDMRTEMTSIYSKGNIDISGGNVTAISSVDLQSGIYARGTISISNVDMTAEGGYPALYSGKAMTIDNSKVDATSRDYWGIWSNGSLAITGASDVITNGIGAGAANAFTVTPEKDGLVDVKTGDSKEEVVHIQGSPFSEETILTNVGKDTYFSSTIHIHAGGTADCQLKAVCSACGQDYGEIDAANHTKLVKTEGKEPTHLSEGNMAYWMCADCGKYFSDDNGTEEITLADTVKPKTAEHTADKSGWHFDEKSHWNICECGEVINQTNHKLEWVIEKKATATEKGSKHEECMVCGYKKASVEIAASGTENTTQKPDANKNTVSPPTGDGSHASLWILLGIASGSVLIGASIIIVKRKRI